MTNIDVMKLGLDALENHVEGFKVIEELLQNLNNKLKPLDLSDTYSVIAALRTAISEAEQAEHEPVAWRWEPSKVLKGYVVTDDQEKVKAAIVCGAEVQPLYTAPPKEEQEPVACWLFRRGEESFGIALEKEFIPEDAHDISPLYPAPLQKPWVSLTDDDDIDAIAEPFWNDHFGYSEFDTQGFSRAIEAKLKEKNT